MSFALLDDKLTEHPKWLITGSAAHDMFIAAICYCARLLTDGFVPRAQVRKLIEHDDPLKVAEELVKSVPPGYSFGFFERHADGYLVHDYLEWNPCREDVLAKRDKRAEAGRKGGQNSVATRRERYGTAQPEGRTEANASDCASGGASDTPSKQTPNPTPTPTPTPLPTPIPTTPTTVGVPAAHERRCAPAPDLDRGGEPESSRAKLNSGSTTHSWERYAAAYRQRWGVEPARNAQTNALLSQLAKLVGQPDAPEIAAFYVTLNKRWYVHQQHDLKYLVQDAQSVRAQWMTGRTVTSREATDTDRMQGGADMWARVESRLDGSK